MCSVIEGRGTSLNKAQLVGLESGTMLVPSYGWQEFLGPFYSHLKAIKSLFHFKINDNATVVAYTAEVQDVSYQLLKDPSKIPPKDLPKHIPPPGLSLERSKYLYNIRHFVRDDCKDLLCPAVHE
ncbi:hypothetical protein RRG08_033310 [Elysia crispata]|uniref:Uncharacterized protein n=1 Tax=Elysia crispata TaxID=231223 RepID=A0AAE1CJ57_9GAST|nr:hypothetical protein RRG08_033310 [Elysia crispata]